MVETVLLEWDSNLANSCSIFEKKNEFHEIFCFSAIFHLFQLLFLPVAREKPIMTQTSIHTR